MKMKHTRAFTKKDKIPDVLAGIVTHTIRPKGKRIVRAGDTIQWHGWVGRAYRSKWSKWRMWVEVTYVMDIEMNEIGIRFPQTVMFESWSSMKVDRLAIDDGFSSGVEMGNWFNDKYDLRYVEWYQAMWWDAGKTLCKACLRYCVKNNHLDCDFMGKNPDKTPFDCWAKVKNQKV